MFHIPEMPKSEIKIQVNNFKTAFLLSILRRLQEDGYSRTLLVGVILLQPLGKQLLSLCFSNSTSETQSHGINQDKFKDLCTNLFIEIHSCMCMYDTHISIEKKKKRM